MSEQEFDLLLQDSLMQAALAEYRDELPVGQEAWTLPYRRDREQLRRDPKGWSKKKLRPLWRTVLQRAACFLLACLVGFSVVMATVPAARAAVLKWFRQVYADHITYVYTGEETETPVPHYKITSLPEGYREIQVLEGDYTYITINSDENGRQLYLTVDKIEDSMTNNIEITGEESHVQINGNNGTIYISDSPDVGSTVVWTDEAQQLMFTLSGFFAEDELIELAESVQLAENEEGLGELS
jgi:hypothetical protein